MNQKIYEPVTEFERQTNHCPLYLAWQVLDEFERSGVERKEVCGVGRGVKYP